MRLVTSGIYTIRHRPSNRVYVGSSKNLSNRIYEHQWRLQKGTHPNKHLQNVWMKYEGKDFEFAIVEVCSQERLLEREQVWMNQLRGIHLMMNTLMVAGSSYGWTPTPETRAKISAALKGREMTPEQYAFQSDRMRAFAERQKGIPLAPETKAKLSAKAKGRPSPAMSPEGRERIRQKMLGREVSPETRAKIAAAREGKGHTLTAGQITRRSATYEVTSPDGHTQVIENLKAFCVANDLDSPSMVNVAGGKYRHHKGWTCKKLTSAPSRQKVETARGSERKPRPASAALKAAKEYELTSPDGKVFTVRNLSAFARENALQAPSLVTVASGRQTHHKGWKCKRL